MFYIPKNTPPEVVLLAMSVSALIVFALLACSWLFGH